ncbi:MAG: glycoside hydrolase family 9 protein [Bacteroidales bacterium]|nr:glycoside hydrolase family 9 protein [Bacteroidales bacterium]
MKRLTAIHSLFFLSFLCSHSQTIDPRIKTDQFGYLPDSRKIAVISSPQVGFNAPDDFVPGSTYEVRRAGDNSVAYSGNIDAWNGGSVHAQSGDKVWWFEFSSLTETDYFYIYDPEYAVRSGNFSISPDVYNAVLITAARMFCYQRCGTLKSMPYVPAKWSDLACHVDTKQDLDCRLVTAPSDASRARDLSGGWHDAGDFNKYVNFTNSVMHNLLSAYDKNPSVFLDNYSIPESGNGIPDILDEIKWEMDWLLKMQQADGSVLMKVSVNQYQADSPPSHDKAQRFYGPAAASATRVFCGIAAHAYLIYKDIPALIAYAGTLLDRALLAWEWLTLNPGISDYDNTGFNSANPEISAYHQQSVQAAAAVYLFDATGDTAYRGYFDRYYKSFHPYQWTYWYPYENQYQDAMLYYCELTGATPAVADDIRQNCIQSVQHNNHELLEAWQGQQDAYMAYLSNGNYIWGSNQVKCHTGNIFCNMTEYNLDPANAKDYRDAAEGYIHYMHGVNPLGMVMLTNMYNYGAEKSVNEIYHGWFHDGTDFDNALSSLYGPPPGYVTGGPNPIYEPDASYVGDIVPPQNQPIQKSYRDWNTSWPENSWEITEPAIYYQAAYIKLLSKFVSENPVSDVREVFANDGKPVVFPNPAGEYFTVRSEGHIIKSVALYHINGSHIYTIQLDSLSDQALVHTKSLNKGIYIVKVFTEEGMFYRKVVVEK